MLQSATTVEVQEHGRAGQCRQSIQHRRRGAHVFSTTRFSDDACQHVAAAEVRDSSDDTFPVKMRVCLLVPR